MKLPDSTLTKKQTRTFLASYTERGHQYSMTVTVRHDDQCGNGHNTFSITADIRENGREYMGGCCHDEVAKHVPELAPFIKWHLTSTDGPMHYVANTVYLAGNRDHNGLLKGERRQIVNGRTKKPAWKLALVDKDGNEKDFHEVEKYLDSDLQPECGYTVAYRPWCTVGEGKERQLESARSVAVWPEATDEQLSQEPEALKAALMDRLPGLMAEFKSAVESLGFTY